MKLTLGFSPCPNDTFIFDALIHQKIDTEGLEFEVFYDDVETLNQKAFSQVLDITKLSFHAYAYVANHYVLLDAGSALGFGVGPLLVSGGRYEVSGMSRQQSAISNQQSAHNSQPTAQSSQPTADSSKPEAQSSKLKAQSCPPKIGIPGKYTTANFLLSLAYPHLTNKVEMLFSDIENALLQGNIDLGLIIHENRFTYQEKGLHKVLDLGEYWEKETGYAIPLGGIVIKRELPEELKLKVNRVLRRSVEFAFEHPKSALSFIRQHAQSTDESVMYKHIGLYVNKYSIDLGLDGRTAIEMLFEKALSLQLIPEIKEELFLNHTPFKGLFSI